MRDQTNQTETMKSYFHPLWNNVKADTDCAALVDLIRANVAAAFDAVEAGETDNLEDAFLSYHQNVIDTIYTEKAVEVPEWVSRNDVHNLIDCEIELQAAKKKQVEATNAKPNPLGHDADLLHAAQRVLATWDEAAKLSSLKTDGAKYVNLRGASRRSKAERDRWKFEEALDQLRQLV